MTEEQLIQEYSDCICPKIAKALIKETKDMVIEKAIGWVVKNTVPKTAVIFQYYDGKEFAEQFKKSMEE